MFDKNFNTIDDAVKDFLPTIKDALNCPEQELIDFALILVNLKDREKEVILQVDKAGKRQEKVAEIMDVDVKTVQNNLRTAHRKLYLVWKNNSTIEYMAERGRKCKL